MFLGPNTRFRLHPFGLGWYNAKEILEDSLQVFQNFLKAHILDSVQK